MRSQDRIKARGRDGNFPVQTAYLLVAATGIAHVEFGSAAAGTPDEQFDTFYITQTLGTASAFGIYLSSDASLPDAPSTVQAPLSPAASPGSRQRMGQRDVWLPLVSDPVDARVYLGSFVGGVKAIYISNPNGSASNFLIEGFSTAGQGE